jgi:hypothetical protein
MVLAQQTTDSFILRVDGQVQAMPPPGHGEAFTLDQCQGAVGGLVEMIYLPNNIGFPEPMIVLVNEEGLIRQLQRNPLATLLLGSLSESIHGDVVVMPARRFE